MKTTYLSLFAATALLLGTACSNSEEAEAPYANNDTAVRFTASTRSEGEDDNAQTTGGATSTLSVPTQGVRISRDGETFYNYTADDSGNLTPETSNFVTWMSSSESSMYIYACAPASGATTAEHFYLRSNQANGTDVADYATFAGSVSRPTGAKLGDANYNDVAFTLQRRMAKVNLTVSASDYPKDYSYRLKVYSQGSEVTISKDLFADVDNEHVSYMASDEYCVIASGDAVEVTPQNAVVSRGEGTASAIVTPSAPDGNAKFIEVQMLDGNGHEYGSPMYIMGIPALSPGVSYNFKLNIQDDKIYVVSVEVTSWSDNIDIEGGDAEIEVPTVYILNLDEYETYSDDELYTLIEEAIQANSKLTTLRIVGEWGNRSLRRIVGYNQNYSTTKYLNYTTIDLSGIRDLTAIEDYAFAYNRAIQTIILPEFVTSIGSDAFFHCDALTNINVENVTALGTYSFATCLSLKSISMPILPTIPAYAFDNCSSLSTANFPIATSIGYCAFSSCDKLTIVNCPKATSVETEAFDDCRALTSLYLPKVTTLGDAVLGYNESFLDCDLTLNQKLSNLVSGNQLYGGEMPDVMDDYISFISLYYTFKSITLVDDED